MRGTSPSVEFISEEKEEVDMASNYIPSAGYMYDLLFMYKLYFNKGEWMTEFVLHKKAEQNRDFYVSIMKLFDTAPEEGALFFYVKDAGQTFMDTLLFEMMHCGEGLSFSEFRDAFKDGAVTKRKLFFYYLDPLSSKGGFQKKLSFRFRSVPDQSHLPHSSQPESPVTG